MAIRQGFFNSPDSQNPDRLYFAENWNDINDITFGDGYSLKKTPDQTFVKYNPAGVGEILIDIVDFAALLRGYYYIQESETLQKSLPLATQDRIDLIVLRLQGNSSASRVLSVEVIQGTEAPVPVAPPINTGVGDIWDLVLAQVYVTGGEATLPNGQSDITMIVAKMELAGFAAEATKAFQDENGRNIADNLQISTFKSLASLGLTDANLTGGQTAAFNTIINAMPFNSRLTADVVEFGISGTNLLTLFPISRGNYEIIKGNQSAGNSGVMMWFFARNTETSPVGGSKTFVATMASVFSGWVKQVDENGTSANSLKLGLKLPEEYVKRETQNFAGQTVPLGFRQIVKFDSTAGRGSWLVTVRNSHAPAQVSGITMIVNVSFNSTAAGGRDQIIILSNSNVGDIWESFRIMFDSGATRKYLEMNNVSAVDFDSYVISVQPLTDEQVDDRTAYSILDPITNAGGLGTEIYRIDATQKLFNSNDKLFVTIDGNSASGVELENFGATGLQITTDTDPLNATVISSNLPSEYTHLLLEVGQGDLDSKMIEVPINNTQSGTGKANRTIDDNSDTTTAIEKTYARFFIDGTTLKGYFARSHLWSGNSGDSALFGTSLVEVYKVWGVVR